MKLTSLVARSTPLLVLLAACGGDDGADPAAVRARLDATLPGLVDSTGRSLAYLGDSAALTGVTGSLDALDRAFPLPFDLSIGSGEENGPLAAAGEDDGEGDDEDDELDGQELADRLAEALFNDANDEGDGVYRIPAELLCSEDPETGAIDADCAARIDDAELRVRVVEAGDGLDFTLLVGPARDEPVALELRSGRATIAVDLAEARAAVVFVASLGGETVELPEVMEGVVAASLTVLGEGHVSIDLATRTAVRVEGATDEGPIAFATAARQPLIALGVDAVAHAISARLDLGVTTVSAPWSMIDSESLATGRFHLDWKGLSARATVAEGDEGIAIEDIGFGDGTSTLGLDDLVLFALDLNADSGRRFDLTIAPSEGGLPHFALSPGLDLSLAFALAPLAAAGDAVESFLLDETYRVTFDGSGPAAQPIDATEGFAGGLAILGGQLSIASTAAEAPVVAATGQCLVGDEVTEGEHPIIGAFAVVDCP